MRPDCDAGAVGIQRPVLEFKPQAGKTDEVVVVESPAKAKTINKYLGPGYKVMASFGHVRDLPAKDGSVRPDDDFDMSWEVDTASAKRMKDIADAVKESDGAIWQPTRIAKAKRFPGMFWTC